jgi:hypothetical protein
MKTSANLVAATEDLDTAAQANADAISANNTNIQAELDATQTGAGLATDGTYTANASTNFMKTSANLVAATEDLDTATQANADAISTNNTNIQAELDATQTGAGLEIDGTYIANPTANYIDTATALNDADNKLDIQAKANADAITAINMLAVDKVYLGDNLGVATEVATTGSDDVVRATSPTFTGIPIAPTANPDTNSTQIATTAYVNNKIITGLGSGGSNTSDITFKTVDLSSFTATNFDINKDIVIITVRSALIQRGGGASALNFYASINDGAKTFTITTFIAANGNAANAQPFDFQYLVIRK